MCARAGGPRSRDDPVSARRGLPPGQRLWRPAARTGGGPPPGEPGAGSPSGGLREGTRHRSGAAGGGSVRQRQPLPGDGGTAGRRSGTDAGQGVHLPRQPRLVRTRQSLGDGGLAGECVRIQREQAHGRGGAGAELGDPRGGILRPGTAGEPAGGFHRPGRRKVSHRPAPWGAGRGGGAVRPHPPGRGGGQRPLLSGTGPRPQADGAPDTGADGLRLARLSGGPGVRRAGGERFLRGDDLRRRRGLPDLCALCPAPV